MVNKEHKCGPWVVKKTDVGYWQAVQYNPYYVDLSGVRQCPNCGVDLNE